MDEKRRQAQLNLYKDFILNCTNNANSLKNYLDFKRINECLQLLFPEKIGISILDFDDAKVFEDVVNMLEKLKVYIDYNAKGKNQYSTTISWYQRFLNAKNLFSKHEKTIHIAPKETNKCLQQIFYGAPGTGKSHKIKDNAKVREAGEKNLVFRTTFHPDSDYSTFVGAYKPTMRPVPNQYKAVAGKDEEITYSFVPQAFLQAYVAAWNNQGDDVFLIIEEINRGNCAQIFGDLFQLLDRDGNGFSEYPIMADKDLAKYLGGKDEDGQDILTNKDGIKDDKLRLPNNLYIWATMNTSDQSLFPIDSAFKRSGDWKYIKIKEGRDENGNKLDWKVDIKMDKEGTLLPWWDFIKKINEIIASMTSSADKQLGYFFCCAKDDVIDEETFVSKVIFYLWNDVFKDYGFEDASLFCYTDKDGKEQDLTFPDFYDEDGENVNTERLTDFVKKVMSWKADSKKDEDK